MRDLGEEMVGVSLVDELLVAVVECMEGGEEGGLGSGGDVNYTQSMPDITRMMAGVGAVTWITALVN